MNGDEQNRRESNKFQLQKWARAFLYAVVVVISIVTLQRFLMQWSLISRRLPYEVARFGSVLVVHVLVPYVVGWAVYRLSRRNARAGSIGFAIFAGWGLLGLLVQSVRLALAANS